MGKKRERNAAVEAGAISDVANLREVAFVEVIDCLKR